MKGTLRSVLCPILVGSLFCVQQVLGDPVIAISNPSPPVGGKIAFLNPLLSAEIAHGQGTPMDIRFSIRKADGNWQDIQRFSQAKGGRFRVRPQIVRERNQSYQWKVIAGDGKNTSEQVYRFTVVPYVGEEEMAVAEATCWKYGYIRRGGTPGRFYVATQAAYGRGAAAYDINRGWYDTFAEIPCLGHPCWGYWDNRYHRIGNVGQGGGYSPFIGQLSSDTFEGLQKMNRVQHARQIGRWIRPSNPEPSTFTFHNDRAWILGVDYDKETKHGLVRYWEWTKQAEEKGLGWRGMGWKDPVTIGATRFGGGHAAVLPIDRDTWYCYVIDGAASASSLRHDSTLHYFKSEDGGKSWSTIHDTGIPAHACWSHVSFARYGHNYYVFLTDQGDTLVYSSHDGENWDPQSRKGVSPETERRFWTNSHGALLNQEALIYTSNRGIKYIDKQYGFIVPIDTLRANPGTPANASPPDQTELKPGTTATALQVEVKGEQVYDVAFYWADHRFIEVARLLRDGDTAQASVSGLEPGRTYGWYAVSRGSTLEYSGEPDSTSDEAWTEVHTFTVP